MRVPKGPSNVPWSLKSGVRATEITTKPAVKIRDRTEPSPVRTALLAAFMQLPHALHAQSGPTGPCQSADTCLVDCTK
jgi:hypothetical protein